MNQFKLLFSIFLLSSIVLTSCLKDVELNSDDNKSQELVVLAEWEEGVDPFLRISTTFDVNAAPEPIDGNFASVTFSEFSNSEAPRALRPDQNDLSYFFLASTTSFELKQGESYNLKVDVPDLGMLPLTGQTTMPFRGDIDNINDVLIVAENSDFTEISVSLNLADTPDDGSYYHLTPYIIDNTGAKIYPDFSRILSGENGVTLLTHRDGILIDISSLDNTNLLEFHLRSLLPLDINQLSDKNLYFKLNTVAEEYYLYHQSVSRQFETNQSPFTIPTLSYSQFENGYGIFTAFSSEIFESPIN